MTNAQMEEKLKALEEGQAGLLEHIERCINIMNMLTEVLKATRTEVKTKVAAQPLISLLAAQEEILCKLLPGYEEALQPEEKEKNNA